MRASDGASQSSATSGWTWPTRPARRRRPGANGIRERRSPGPAVVAGPGATVVLSVMRGPYASAAVFGSLLQLVQRGLGGAAHGTTEVLLHGELDLVPRGVIGR